MNVRHLASGIFLTVDTGAARYNRIWLGTNEAAENGHLVEEATVLTGGGRCIVSIKGEDGEPLTKSRIDFGTRSAIGNNLLNVYLNGVATLAELAGGSHTVVLEKAFLEGWSDAKPATLIVEDESTIDDVEEYAFGRTTVETTADGTEVPLFFVGTTSSASIEGTSTIGTLTNDGYVEFTETSNPSTVTEFDVTPSLVTSSASEVVLGPGETAGANVTVLTTSRIGSLTISKNAKLTLQQRSASPSQTAPRMLTMKSLYIWKSAIEPQGTLDVKDNSMIIDYTSTSPFADIEDLITAGYDAADAGFWDGYGITSSIAASQSNKGIGYAEANDLFPTFPVTWDGQQLNSTMVLVKYTYYGDATLDGLVNLADFTRLANNFGQQPRTWSQGNFNFDAVVNLADFTRLVNNFGQSGLGDGDPEDIEDISPEELADMLENW